MFLPRKNSWTIIDFECTVRSGVRAPLYFTVLYSAPEIVDAYAANQKTIFATEALDAWAMGVVAFELVTGSSAFSALGSREQVRAYIHLYSMHTSCARSSAVVHGRQPFSCSTFRQVFRQLQGREDLPWEGAQNADVRKRLGAFKSPILSLLKRNPDERDSLDSFCRSCQDVFTQTSATMC